MRKVLIVSLLCCLTFNGARAGGASIEVYPEFPKQASSARITVLDDEGSPLAGVEVKVTYRPESKVAETVVIGVTDSSGTLTWLPEDAGIVTVSARVAGESITKTVSVRFSSLPKRGMLVLIVAGLILIGGSVRRFLGIMSGSRSGG